MWVRRTIAIASAVVALGVMTACSSDSSSGEAATSAETAAETAAETMDSSEMLPPVIVEPGQTEATAKVGDFIDIVVEEVVGTTIDTPNTDIVEIFQAREEGGAVFNPGAKALAPGVATITVTKPDNTTYDLVVTVTE